MCRSVASAGLPPEADQRSDRVFYKLIQVLRFGCSYQGIADSTCSATTIRDRRDEWNRLGIFSRLKQIVLETYDRIVGLILTDIAVDGCITKAPGGGECAGRSPVDRGKQGMKRSSMVDGYGIPLGRVPAGANRHDSPLLAPTLDKLDDLGPLPDDITVHLECRLRLGENPRRTLQARNDRRDRPQMRQSPDPSRSTPAGRAHQVRREALCCIPGSAGRDLEGGSWVEWLTWIRKVKGTRACQETRWPGPVVRDGAPGGPA
jgi:transposase